MRRFERAAVSFERSDSWRRISISRLPSIVLRGLGPFLLALSFDNDGARLQHRRLRDDRPAAHRDVIRQKKEKYCNPRRPGFRHLGLRNIARDHHIRGNPGKHGIYGFTEAKPGTQTIFFPNFGNVRCDTLWDVAGRAGKRCIVLNVPNTYPARAMNGLLVSGFVAINLERAVYPASLLPRLTAQSYRIDVDYTREAWTTVTFTLEPSGAGTKLSVSETGFNEVSLARRAKVFKDNDQGWAEVIVWIQQYAEAKG